MLQASVRALAGGARAKGGGEGLGGRRDRVVTDAATGWRGLRDFVDFANASPVGAAVPLTWMV